MINSADHHDLSVVCQAQTYQIVGQQKSGPLEPVGGQRGVEADLSHPLLPTGLKMGERWYYLKVCQTIIIANFMEFQWTHT